MRKKLIFLIGCLLASILSSACKSTVKTIEVTRDIPQTVVVTQRVTQIVTQIITATPNPTNMLTPVPPTPIPTATPTPTHFIDMSSQDGRIVVIQYYTLLGLHLYDQAYQLLSANFKTSYPENAFLEDAANDYQVVKVLQVIPAKEVKGTNPHAISDDWYHVKIYAEGVNGFSGPFVNGEYYEYVLVVRENGEWKVDKWGDSPDPLTQVPIHFVERLRIGKGIITGIAFSPDQERILVATPIGISLLEAKTFAELWFQPTETQIASMAFSPDGLSFAAGQSGGIVQLYETTTGNPGIHFRTDDFSQTGYYPTVAWSPDGKALLIGAGEGAVGLWEAQTGDLIHVLKTPLENGIDSATQAAYSGDGRYILVSAWGQVTVWDAHSYQQVSTFGEGKAEMSISLSKELPWVATHQLNAASIDLWDWKSGQHIRTLQVDPQTDGVATGFGWEADGTTLLVSYLINSNVKFIAWGARTGTRP